jgi:Uma2 family endonuclease
MEQLHHWEDFIALPDEDKRELVDGRLLETEMPNKWHERIVGSLIIALGVWCQKRGLQVLGSGFKVRVSDTRGAMPDVQVLTRETFDGASENGLESGHPELVVEIISPGSRAHDRVRKLAWYASIGVPEYWIVDADVQTIERLVLEHGTYRIDQTAQGNQIFKPRSMRGLHIDLRALWAPPPKSPARRR